MKAGASGLRSDSCRLLQRPSYACYGGLVGMPIGAGHPVEFTTIHHCEKVTLYQNKAKFHFVVVLENNNGYLTPLSVEGLPLFRSL